jgi:hypothetical protein
VLIYEAPDAGANVSVVAASGFVSIVDNQTGRVLALRSLADVSQVILVGSDTAADVFNMFLGTANGGLEGGVTAYAGSSAADRLNVFGLPFVNDTFGVGGRAVSANMTAVHDSDVVVERSAESRDVTVNGNRILGTGFETTRLVTLGGSDAILDPLSLALVAQVWNPLSWD